MPASRPAIEVRSLRKVFEEREVLKDLSLRVMEGELYVLVGPDGAGKTTLLRILAGVMTPTSGEVWIREGGVEYMPQRFSLYGDLTVEENLEFYREVYRIPKGEWEKRRDLLLDITRLKGFEKRLASKLSGGMQKKLALAITLLPSPKVLLLDEPTTGVDPISRRDLWELLSGILKEGMTILLTTPYIEEAYKANKVGFLFDGRLLLEGSPEDLLRRGFDDLEDLFFHLIGGEVGSS
jgi:ABC-2 type transport system ATP-binding protein